MIDELKKYQSNLESYKPELVATGRLTRVSGLILEASGFKTKLGGICRILNSVTDHDEPGVSGESSEAEVVGFEGSRIFMMPVTVIGRLEPGAEVVPVEDKKIGVGECYLGRVINGNGQPLDGKGEIEPTEFVSFQQQPINPLHRRAISETLDTGIVAINAILSVGRGQRIGLFAGSGVGKSVLMAMMTSHTRADVIIVGLIGERGREVKEFIENTLKSDGLSRSVVVVAPADDSPTMKIRGAMLATRLAEYFRDQGQHVLLLMDSLTRFAQAQRQISLALGEPPSTKGYPPSVFARIPELVERAGNGTDTSGSITAFYTVLTEGDDLQDPIADAARAILDGHIVLSRQLAESGHYPAVDIGASISRLMPNIVSAEHLALAQKFRRVYSTYQRNEDLITVGAYSAGSDKELDYAVDRMPVFREFLKQGIDERLRFDESLGTLKTLF